MFSQLLMHKMKFILMLKRYRFIHGNKNPFRNV